MRALLGQLARFGAVGAVGFVVDVGVFNLLRATLLSSESLHEGPLLAKFISTCLAIAVNYVGNRYWTFGATKRAQVVREGIEFVLVSLGGMAITLACLWVSHYALGFTSQLADRKHHRSRSRHAVPLRVLPLLGVPPEPHHAATAGREPGRSSRQRATARRPGNCARRRSSGCRPLSQASRGRGRGIHATR
jgi:putative flippase GtrA